MGSASPASRGPSGDGGRGLKTRAADAMRQCSAVSERLYLRGRVADAWLAHMRRCHIEEALADLEAAETRLEKLTGYAERRCARFERRADDGRL